MKIIYFGTPHFAAHVLSYLIEQDVAVAAVVTRTDKPKGRSGAPAPSPVKELVRTKVPQIPLLQPPKVSAPEFAPELAKFSADLFVVVAYGEILKQHVLDMPKKGCINLHASLLPKYRGAAPIQRAIIEGEKETGATVMEMVLKMDAGDMIRSVKVPIGANDTFGQVEERLRQQGAQLLLEVIKDYEKGAIRKTPQEEALATYAPKIESADCRIDWSQSATAIHNLVRGVHPYPGAWCEVMVKGAPQLLKIKSTRIVDGQGQPGQILYTDWEGLVIACGQGALRILELQLQGKRAMTPAELLRGTPLIFANPRS